MRPKRGYILISTVFLLVSVQSFSQLSKDASVLKNLRRCSGPSTTGLDCDEIVTGAEKLYWRGRSEFLRPLLRLSSKTDNATILEGLGTFYADALEQRTAEVIRALNTEESKTLNTVCKMARLGDGGGIRPDQEKRIRSQLSSAKALNSRSAEIAVQCLVAFNED